MNVPNTDSFTLQNVVDVVGGNSLTQAFTNSTDAYFDVTYKGSKNSLLNFRNYTPASYEYIMSYTAYASYELTCSEWNPFDEGVWVTVYSDDATPGIGTQFYSNSTLTTEYDLSDEWRGVMLASDIETRYAVIGTIETGNVAQIETCGSYDYMERDPNSFVLDNTAQTVYSYITSNQTGFTYSFDESQTWCTVDASGTEGDVILSITVEANSTGLSRGVTFVITWNGGLSEIGISIEQNP